MAIGRVPGAALLGNLDRQGLDLGFTTNSTTLLQLDFTNYRLGINTATPQQALDVTGNILVTTGNVYTSTDLTYDIGAVSTRWNNIYAGNVTSTNLTGTLTTAAQTNITSVGTLSSLTVSGNIIAQSSVVPTSNIAGNIGYANRWWSAVYANTINATNLNGTILTANQPNIANLGNISVYSISVGGNVVIGGNINGSTITANAFIQNGHAVVDTITTINVTGDATGAGNISNIALTLANTGVVAGIYGSADDEIADRVPKITVDSKGRITSISNVALTQIGNVSFSDTTISTTNSITLNSANNGNITLNANGTGIVKISGNDAFAIPTGNTLVRPTNVAAGYVRYNTDLGTIEFYNGVDWDNNQSGIITSQTISPTGATNIYTLLDDATTDGVLVSINGTLQQPTTAYTVVGNVITFTETPLTTDIIEVRAISIAIHSIPTIADGNTRIETDAVSGEIALYNYGTEYLKINQAGVIVGLNPNTAVATSAVATTIDTYDNTLYRTAKYVVQATRTTNMESYEVLVTHNGATAYSTTYGVINSGTSLGTISATISGSNVLVQYTATGTNTNIRLSKNYLII